MTLSSAMRASASGLAAERFRMDVASVNLANANTTQVGNRAPYRARDVVLQAGTEGVQIAAVRPNASAFRMIHEPGNPNADANGNVLASNVEPINEMVNMMGASRAYEANIAAFNTAKSMVKRAMDIGKV